MNLFKKSSKFFLDEEYKIHSNNFSHSKNKFNKTMLLDNKNNKPNILTITSYTVQDKNNNNKMIPLKNNIKIFHKNTNYNMYNNNSKLINYNNKNSTYLKKINSKIKIKKFYPNKTNSKSLKQINLQMVIDPNYSNENINLKNRSFSQHFGKIKRKINNSYFSTFSSKIKNKIIDLDKSLKNKNTDYEANNTYSYVYNDKINMKFSKSLYKYKYIKQRLYLAKLQNINNKKYIFNLSPEEYNEKNKLFSPLNTTNYNKELKYLGNKFITKDIISFPNSKDNFINNREKLFEKKEKNKKIGNIPCFIENRISYNILNKVKFNIKSPSERGKCKKFLNKFNSFEYISKL